MELIVTVLGAIAILALIFFLGLRACLFHVPPEEIVVMSGVAHRRPSGEVVGYRVYTGGVGFRPPIVGKIDRVSTRPIEFDFRVSWKEQTLYGRVRLRMLLDAVGIDRALRIVMGVSEAMRGEAVRPRLEETLRDGPVAADDEMAAELVSAAATSLGFRVEECAVRVASDGGSTAREEPGTHPR